jgi:hypothetical protein
MSERLTKIFQKLDNKQLMGLLALNSLAIREVTSVYYQWKEWGLNDIPLSVVIGCEQNGMEPTDLIEILAAYVLKVLATREAVKSLWSIPPSLWELLDEDYDTQPDAYR